MSKIKRLSINVTVETTDDMNKVEKFDGLRVFINETKQFWYWDKSQDNFILESGGGAGGNNPAGNDGEVQFNNNGEFGASSDFLFQNGIVYIGPNANANDDTTSVLQVVGPININGTIKANNPVNSTDVVTLSYYNSNILSKVLTGYVIGTNTAIVNTDTILQAFGKIQAILNAKINNSTSVQTGSSFNIDTRAIVTQANLATTTNQFGNNQVSPLTVIGGNGQSTSSSLQTAGAGNAGLINIQGGNGGSLTGTPSLGTAGSGGFIYITGGNGGTSLSTGTSSGAGGDVEVAGGSGGVASSNNSAGRPGFVSMKGGNASNGSNSNGGHVYVVSGIPSGTGRPGGIFLGLSPSDVIRGTIFIGCGSGELNNASLTDKLYVKGQAKFVDTPIIAVPAINNNEVPTLGQVTANGTTANRTASPKVGQFYFDTTLNKPIWYSGTNWVDATGTTV